MPAAVTSILDIIADRLALITTANEYNYTITNITRGKLTPWKSEDLPAINYWSTGLNNTRSEYQHDERSIPLFIESHTKTYDSSFVDIASKLASDIITALNRATIAPAVSDTESFDLGGVVSDLIFNGYDHEIGEGQSPWVGVLVNITIKYNTDLFDMDNYSA